MVNVKIHIAIIDNIQSIREVSLEKENQNLLRLKLKIKNDSLIAMSSIKNNTTN